MSLQDKLTQALKALKPGGLSQSSSSSSPFKNKDKNAVVEADDVIYYSNSDNIYNKQRKVSAPLAFRNRQYVNQRKSKSVFAKHSSPSQHELYAECSSSGQVLKDIKSLDQIKQLYKSVPDFSTLEDEAPHPGLPPNSALPSKRKKFGSNINIRDARKRDLSVQSNNRRQESPVYAVTTASSSMSSSTSRSPTDSGYRSGYRGQINTCSPPPPPAFPPPPLPTQTDRPSYSFVDQNANVEQDHARNSVYVGNASF
uniref:Uncharacterized protein n=1 Tax=Acrobeloides nanus TaxID=290746 RepID=A0A914ECD4_9BILA